MELSRQEYWSRLPFLSPGDLPNPGIEPISLMSPALAGGFFTSRATWEVICFIHSIRKKLLIKMGKRRSASRMSVLQRELSPPSLNWGTPGVGMQGVSRLFWVWCQLWIQGSESTRAFVAWPLWSRLEGVGTCYHLECLILGFFPMIQMVSKDHKCPAELFSEFKSSKDCYHVLGRKFKLPVV